MLLQKNQNTITTIIFIIVVITGFWLFNPLPLYFLNDDLIHIPLSKEGVLFQRKSFRPIGDLSLQMDYLFWKKNAVGYHITNLVLHSINSVLVFCLSAELLKKYKQENNRFQSIAAAILFFIYAFHSESVYWIIGRSASLGALFCIPAIIFYLQRHDNKFNFIMSMLFFAAGLLAYESVWVFPLFTVCLSMLDIKKSKKLIKREVIFNVIVFSIFIAHLIIKQQLLGEAAGKYEAGSFLDFNAVVLASNFFKLIIRCFAPPITSPVYFMTVALVVLVMLLCISIFLIKKATHFTIAYIVFIFLLISFLPYLSLGINTHTTEGERYEYLPSVFASLLLVQLIAMIDTSSVKQIGLLCILFSYHLFYLIKAGSNYTVASSISKKTFEQLNELKGKKRLFIDSLPTDNKGALIFRVGFHEGIEWLKNKGTADSIFINSIKTDNKHWKPEFEIKTISDPTILIVNNGVSSRRRTNSMNFNRESDAWFIYESDALKVFK